ncbi:MAG: diguanylate cyclase, partial [Lachnospiraceae bacterium]|nr:diguanylate cyclase [Lachnospiraceae bacterium]
MDKYWLVVADDDYLCLTNVKALLDDDNMRVSCVRSGVELLKFLKKNEPDLILLDVVMPELDGFETYRRLREQEEEDGHRQTPVIFLTGGEDSENEQRGLALGAADFIYKPVKRDVLLSRINNIISNSKTINDLAEEAVTDHLTGFYNKAGTEERMAELCRCGGGMLMILDLDNFKLVNDLYGHDMGDQVLKSFADISRQCSRQEDVLCRIGGDEFLVFFRNAKSERAVAAFSERLNERILNECRKMMGVDFSLPIGVSLGCVSVPE